VAGNGEKRKTMHINLYDDQVADYELVRANTAIQNDNDLVRYLFRQEAHRIRERAGQTPPHGIPIVSVEGGRVSPVPPSEMADAG